MANQITLLSNVKVIRSTNVPTSLTTGEMAFGRMKDGLYHLYGNDGTGITDIILPLIEAELGKFGLQGVLDNGNGAENISIVLQGLGAGFEASDPTDGKAKLTGANLVVEKGTYKAIVDEQKITMLDTGDAVNPERMEMSTENGFVDNGHTVLSGNNARNYSNEDKAIMREKLHVYSIDEISGKLSAVFNFKGIINKYADLPTNAKVGDVYQVTDRENKLFAWVEDASGAGKWEILGFILDLSNYYTMDQVDNDIRVLREALTALIDALAGRMDDAEANIEALNDRIAEDKAAMDEHIAAPRTHSSNDYVDGDVLKVNKLIITGTGNKVLADNGEYVEIVFAIDTI